jgi:hypothetical protein
MRLPDSLSYSKRLATAVQAKPKTSHGRPFLVSRINHNNAKPHTAAVTAIAKDAQTSPKSGPRHKTAVTCTFIDANNRFLSCSGPIAGRDANDDVQHSRR